MAAFVPNTPLHVYMYADLGRTISTLYMLRGKEVRAVYGSYRIYLLAGCISMLLQQ